MTGGRTRARERFGDPRLVNPELVPTPAAERQLAVRPRALLWAAAVLTPALYAVPNRTLALSEAVTAVAGGLLVAGGLAWLLTGSSRRYGIGFVPLCRAAFGVRGALLPLVLRWGVGVLWASAWLSEVGRACVRLASAWLPEGTALAEPLPMAAGATVLALPCVLLAWLAARRGLARMAVVAVAGLGGALLCGFGLAVLAGVASAGFGARLERAAAWDLRPLVEHACLVALLALPALLACGDWERAAAAGRTRLERAATALLPAALPPLAMLLTFLGALLVSATVSLRGEAELSLVADAAAAGSGAGVSWGVLAGAGGALAVSLGVWLAAAPLVALRSSALALSGTAGRLGLRPALLLTAAVVLALVPAAPALATVGLDPALAAATLVAPAAVLLADELLARRGRVLLEELYLYGEQYGGWGGFSPAAFGGVLAGWALHPWLLPRWLALFDTAPEWLAVAPALPGPAPAAALGAAAVVAAGVYLLLRPCEALLRRSLVRRRERRAERAPARMLDEVEGSTTAGLGRAHVLHQGERRPRERG